MVFKLVYLIISIPYDMLRRQLTIILSLPCKLIKFFVKRQDIQHISASSHLKRW